MNLTYIKQMKLKTKTDRCFNFSAIVFIKKIGQGMKGWKMTGDAKNKVMNIPKWLKIVLMIIMPFVAILLFSEIFIIGLYLHFDGIVWALIWIVYIGTPIVSYAYLIKSIAKNKLYIGLLYFPAMYLLLFWCFVTLIKSSGLGELS